MSIHHEVFHVLTHIHGKSKWQNPYNVVSRRTASIECVIESLVFTRDGDLPNLTGWALIISVPVVILGLGVAMVWVIGGFLDRNRRVPESNVTSDALEKRR